MEHYLDNAATTKPCTEAVEMLQHCAVSCYGNPSSLHSKGLEAEHIIKDARKKIADALGADVGEILFTSGATESNNLALRGAAQVYGKRKKKIVVSAVEHACVKETTEYLAKQGYEVVPIFPRENGEFQAVDFLQAIDENTCIVSMMLVNNENGYRMPVEKVFSAAKKRFPDVITHCDAVQGFMKVPFRMRSLQADLLSISAHKIHGLKGCGALFIRKGIRVAPILFGGHQENGLRPGTESVPLIGAFGAAVDHMFPTLEERYQGAKTLRTAFIEKLRGMQGIVIRDYAEVSPYILSISMPGYRSEILLHYLEKRGIYVSSGSACSKGKSSGVLEAFGATREEVDSALRISFSEETTVEDMEALVAGLESAQKEILKSK